MERTVKQIIVFIILETMAKIFVYSFIIMIFVNLALETEILRIWLKPFLKSGNEISLGLIILIIVYLSYEFYRKIDVMILKDIDALIENIKYDNYAQSAGIFEFKMIQEALIRKNKDIKEKDKFVSTTISYISHDMKTPVTIINANIDLLRKNNDIVTDKGIDRISRIENESEKISEYISKLMDVTTSLTRKKNLEKITIKECFRKMQNSVLIYSDSIEEKIEVDWNVKPLDDSYIVCDFKNLDKCIVHLLNNAFEHRRSCVKIEVCKDSKNIIFKVIDDGIGFNQDSLNKAKTMFYTDNFGRTSGKGCGIGLYFVNSFMETVNGELLLCNRENYGAEQIIKIPYYGGSNE